MAKIDDLMVKLQENEDAEDAVIAMLNAIVRQLRDAQTDPAKLDAAIAQIEASTTKLASAVVANTPVE